MHGITQTRVPLCFIKNDGGVFCCLPADMFILHVSRDACDILHSPNQPLPAYSFSGDGAFFMPNFLYQKILFFILIFSSVSYLSSLQSFSYLSLSFLLWFPQKCLNGCRRDRSEIVCQMESYFHLQ